eukprot:CAMPEP_0119034118 /NCGR_PEP_ID=MMETSP1177-20130426/1157_1 /TAXON_ID=2985 /ORGANISM="Ochromonas sp, Strain CCMP1899" /LENGTH=175 /DNA_ID=CAMNT_0006991359 /DNA_START=27 /DNA_END=551 /DNA_ORIENTATION=+
MAAPGVYSWTYAGGNFPVCLRPNGIFYCPQYSAAASWKLEDNVKIIIDWKNFGQYELNIDLTQEGLLEGYQVGKPNNWRKMTFLRPFSAAELLLMGEGGGSVWNFEYQGGAFEVEYRCDGFNHFICNTYPAHSHWTMMDNDKIHISWDKYGEYELEVNSDTKTMTGSKVDQPDNW